MRKRLRRTPPSGCGVQNSLLASAHRILTAAPPFCSLHPPQAALTNVPTGSLLWISATFRCVIVRSGIDVELPVHIKPCLNIRNDFTVFIAVDLHVMVEGNIVPSQCIVFSQILALLWTKIGHRCLCDARSGDIRFYIVNVGPASSCSSAVTNSNAGRMIRSYLAFTYTCNS